MYLILSYLILTNIVLVLSAANFLPILFVFGQELNNNSNSSLKDFVIEVERTSSIDKFPNVSKAEVDEYLPCIILKHSILDWVLL